MADSLISVKHLSVKSGRRYLLNDISWEVNPGEQWVVFGLNGSGKTTLLSSIAGYRRYTSGKINLFGEPLCGDNVLSVRKRIGWVSSSFFDSYYKNESVLDIVLSAKTGTLGRDFSIDEQDVKRAKEMLRKFAIEDKLDRAFSTLSKGERQNVLLARAFFLEPEILVLDEPASGLDILSREKVMDFVRELALENHTSLIYVTHYAEEIQNVFTHAMLLKNGRCFFKGTTDECFSDESMSGFLGKPVHVSRTAEGRLEICFKEGRGER